MKAKKWRFVSNQNSTIIGINDAGIETFTANMNRSLVRETIQNSLDAIYPGCTDPVEVEFFKFELASSDIPDSIGFNSALSKCIESNRSEPDAKAFFETARKVISSQTISVLRVSDYNTIGLEGTDTCAKGTSWSRLVKERGSSNKGHDSGGSFGIGKSAAFACSDLRTIFYSSKDRSGRLSNIGVANLVSFEDTSLGEWTTGIGYYSEDERFTAIPELADFDRSHIRNEPGTDIYILGMHETTNFKKEFITAVLKDFMVSIVKKKLIVRIQGETIDHNTLPKHMSMLNPCESAEISDLLEYYRILTSSDPRIKIIPLDSNVYGKKYNFNDGECTLYLKEGEKLNRRIMITRQAGMRIMEQNRISSSIEFTGVLIIEGKNMNAAFKRMEVPSHDAFEPGRCRGEEKRYTEILSSFKRYLKATVKECFGKIDSKPIDAFGASDFLPDTKENIQEDKLNKDELSIGIKSLDERIVKPSSIQSIVIDNVKAEHESSNSGSRNKPTPNPAPNPESSPKNALNGSTPGKNIKFKYVSTVKRLICTDIKKSCYRLTMIIPTSASKGKLEFTIAGEQSDFVLPIISASVISSGNTEIDGIDKNQIFLKNLKKGTPIKLELQVDFDGYCMMGVNYFYANKK